MGKSKELSDNEERILHGQIKFPLLNDRELADMLDFKMTTLTAIKNRLKKKGYLIKLRIPLFHRFNCELIQISYGNAYPSDPSSNLWKILNQSDRSSPRCFYSLQGSYQYMFLQVFRNYSEAIRSNNRFKKAYLKNRFSLENDFKQILFPLKLTRKINFFDHSPLLKQIFNIEEMAMEGEKNQTTRIIPESVKLKKLEKKILYGLVKFPALADSKVCKKIGTTRQAVARMRKKFEKDRIIKTVKIPNLAKLGYSILVLFHFDLHPNRSSSLLKDGMKKIDEVMPPIFHIFEEVQCLYLSAFRDFEHYQRAKMELYSFFTEKELFINPPTSMPFSLPYMATTQNHDYSRVIKNILGV